jgi:hypothetical protein
MAPQLRNHLAMKPATYLAALLMLTGLGAAPAAADTFVYNLQSALDSVHVKFELPSLQEVVTDQTVFDIATSSAGTITEFSLSGDSSTDCSLDSLAFTGPCWAAGIGGSVKASESGVSGLAFTAPGTYIAGSGDFRTVLTITDVVPESSSWVLFSIVLVCTGFVARKQFCS